jgi:hypothetical protein
MQHYCKLQFKKNAFEHQMTHIQRA